MWAWSVGRKKGTAITVEKRAGLKLVYKIFVLLLSQLRVKNKQILSALPVSRSYKLREGGGGVYLYVYRSFGTFNLTNMFEFPLRYLF